MWISSICGCRKNNASYDFCKHCGSLRSPSSPIPSGSAWADSSGLDHFHGDGARVPGLQGGSTSQQGDSQPSARSNAELESFITLS
eukprot:5842488-Pyramimonas_sp.AAC.1